MDVVNDLHMGSPATTNLGGSLTSTENVSPSKKPRRARKKKKGGAVGGESPHFPLDDSSLKTDATIKDTLHESPVNSTMKDKRRKRKKRKFNANEGNADGCNTPENTFSPKSSTPALDVPLEHPIQSVFTDPITSQFCVELGISQVKEHNMINETEENSNAQNDVQEVNCGHISVVACPKPLAKEYESEEYGRQLEHTEATRNGLCCAAEEIELSTNNINEQRLTTSSVEDIPVEQLETDGRQLDHTEITRNVLCCTGDVSDLNLDKVIDGDLKISRFSLDRSLTGKSKNKLLILDVNGILADFVHFGDDRSRYHCPDPVKELEPDFMLKSRKVYKRPFCDDFLQFCFDRFHVGVWSSRAKSNVDKAMEILLGESASKLLFCWNQSHCTVTHFGTVENIRKPLVLKELRKLWDKSEPDLPWEKGVFNESNTLLLDDSPYKALLNPKHTGIFPYSFSYYDTRDSELGPGGDLRVYLEKLAMAENVQTFVSENPFGQRPIRETNPSWLYYSKVIQAVKSRRAAEKSTTRGGGNC